MFRFETCFSDEFALNLKSELIEIGKNIVNVFRHGKKISSSRPQTGGHH